MASVAGWNGASPRWRRKNPIYIKQLRPVKSVRSSAGATDFGGRRDPIPLIHSTPHTRQRCASQRRAKPCPIEQISSSARRYPLAAPRRCREGGAAGSEASHQPPGVGCWAHPLASFPLKAGYRIWIILCGERTAPSKMDHRGNEAARRPRESAREARQYFFPHCLTVSMVNPFLPWVR